MAEWVDWFIAPLGYAFMLRGLVAVIIVGIVSGVLGTYIILRGMALFGNALAHAILPGVAVAYLVAGNSQWLFVGGLVAGVITALGIGAVSKEGVKQDTATGVIFVSMFALGIALISTVRSYATDLTHFLFGNVLGVSTADLWLIGGFGLLVLVAIALLYKEFLVVSFDPFLARTLRLPAGLFNYLLLLLIAITIVLSLQAVGVALMTAMLVTPAATASMLTRRLPVMMVISATIGALSGVIGLYFSFYMNVASGPAIVLTSTTFFLLALFISKMKGVVVRRQAFGRQLPVTSAVQPPVSGSLQEKL
jgi:manganese/iron transport system permease protein